MLRLNNFDNLINIEQEIFDTDNGGNSSINSSVLTNNQTDYLMNIKLEPASIQSPNDCGTVPLSGMHDSDGKIRHWKCTLCEKSYANKFNLNRHKRGVHFNNRDDSCFETSLTSIKDESYGNLKDFRNSNSYENSIEFQKSPCDTSGKGFLLQGELKRHCKKVDARIKKYICHICSKEFDRKSNLVFHMRVHIYGKIRYWKCTQCEKFFTKKSNLNKHERRVHSNNRDHKCTMCNECFSSNKHLEHHKQKVHSNIRDQNCTMCDKSFDSAQDLERHKKRIHSNIKDQKCTMCEKSYKTKFDLRLHVRADHEKIRECTQCKKSFTSKSDFKKHERTVHFETPQ